MTPTDGIHTPPARRSSGIAVSATERHARRRGGFIGDGRVDPVRCRCVPIANAGVRHARR